MKSSDDPVVVEQSFEASAESVWSAITNIEEMRQWYFDNIPAFRAEVGFETQFKVHSGGRDFLHMWRVTEVVPFKRISYTWEYDAFPGEAVVSFELFDEGNSTRLRLTNSVLKDFPGDIPEFKRESCIAGWEYFIQGRLRDYLEGRD